MKIIQLPDVLHEYLVHLIEAHAARGIHPEEGMAVSHLWDCVKNRVTTIPDAEIAKMTAAGSPEGQSAPKPKGVVVESPQTGQPITVECAECYNETGSEACIRPAHKLDYSEAMGQ